MRITMPNSEPLRQLRRGGWAASLVASTLLLATTQAVGEVAQAVGMIAQVNAARGTVEVLPEGGTHWTPARPLLALRAKDTIRTTADASVLVILSGEARTRKIDSTNSPFVVPAARPDMARPKKVMVLLRATIDYLSINTRDKLAPVSVTRHIPVLSAILSPRNGPVLPGPLVLEWSVSQPTSATVTVASTSRVVLKQVGVTTTILGYPNTAPRLVPGERYRFRIQENRHPPVETWFEIVGVERAEALRQDLADLERELPADTPPSSVAIIKAGHLAEQQLFHDARAILLAALTRDAREPALHLLLGHVYGKTGLPDLATESYGRAWHLMVHDESRLPSR